MINHTILIILQAPPSPPEDAFASRGGAFALLGLAGPSLTRRRAPPAEDHVIICYVI